MSAIADAILSVAGTVAALAPLLPTTDDENLQRLYRAQRELSDAAMALQSAAGRPDAPRDEA